MKFDVDVKAVLVPLPAEQMAAWEQGMQTLAELIAELSHEKESRIEAKDGALIEVSHVAA